MNIDRDPHDLISREETAKMLKDLWDEQNISHGQMALEEAQRRLAALPVLETPPASMEQREIERRLLREAHEEVDASNKAIEEAKKRADSLCDTTADNDWTRGKKWGASFVAMALDPSRYQTDDLGAPVEPVPAPRLEWNFYPDNGYYWTTRAPWEIHVARDANSYGDGTKRIAPVKLEGSIYVGCESLDAAKSLAEQLNAVLSPPVGPQE